MKTNEHKIMNQDKINYELINLKLTCTELKMKHTESSWPSTCLIYVMYLKISSALLMPIINKEMFPSIFLYTSYGILYTFCIIVYVVLINFKKSSV